MGIFAQRVRKLTCARCGEQVDVADAEPFQVVACRGCGASLRVPVRFGQFRLTKLLGKGAMAKVFQAEDMELGRQVAVKILRPTVSESGEAGKDLVQACVDEARALAALNHRNVVQIHSIGQHKGQPYIVMELVIGGRLDKVITTQGPVDEAQALAYGIDVAQGLRAAHEVGLIHGDVKPGNILMDNDGVAKLVDFGIARFRDKPTEQTVFGTPQYVAPEVAMKKEIDFRADIFGLGATLYRTLTGTYPFKGDTTKDVVKARFAAMAPDVRETCGHLHADTAAVIQRMLMTEPDARQASYDELIDDLTAARQMIGDMPGSESLAELRDAVQTAPHRRKTDPPPKKKSLGFWPALVAVAALLIVAAVVGIWLSGSGTA